MYPPVTNARAPEMGATVRTPSGRLAIVVAIHEAEREATVQRIDDAEQVRFRWTLLRPAGGTEAC